MTTASENPFFRNKTAVRVPFGRRRKKEFVFREFFEMGFDISVSPFLDETARAISRNFELKVAIFSACLLFLSFLFSYLQPCSPFGEILLVFVYFIVGVPSLIDSVEDLAKKDINIDVLMTVAAFAAYVLGNGLEGALLLVLFAISGALEDVVTLKAKRALRAIHSIAPTKATVIGSERRFLEKAVQDVTVGSHIFVQQHEIVPLDGLIIEGTSFVSMAHLTGESRPIAKQAGDSIASGAKLLDGSLTIEVTHTSLNSTVSRIIDLITKAEAGKPKLERFFDRLSRTYALSVISFAFLFALLGPTVLDLEFAGREGSIYRALAFLIAASPCALILAVPTAYLSALSALAKIGIVLKGGIVLDAINTCSMVVFDKTGTLTLGELSLVKIDRTASSTLSDEEVLGFAAALERYATHPIARALVQEAEQRKLVLVQPKNVKVIPGSGVEGYFSYNEHEVKVFIGDVKKANGESITSESIAQRQNEAYVLSLLVIGKESYLLCFEDKPRSSVLQMLQNLKKMGRMVVMLTGDHKIVAQKIARYLDIERYEAELTPEDKLRWIEDNSKQHGLAMVGDGINDAPALARATVGICMGKVGSSAAQEVSDVVYLRDNIELTDVLFTKAEKTKSIVMQNLIIAACAIVIASVPALCGIVPLWLAVILHEGGTVVVGLNATRLLKDV